MMLRVKSDSVCTRDNRLLNICDIKITNMKPKITKTITAQKHIETFQHVWTYQTVSLNKPRWQKPLGEKWFDWGWRFISKDKRELFGVERANQRESGSPTQKKNEAVKNFGLRFSFQFLLFVSLSVRKMEKKIKAHQIPNILRKSGTLSW